jgi:outer membrane protein assembly factor BamB
VSDRIVAWNGGGDVYTLNMDTMVWTRHVASGTVIPTSQSGTGTYGRFQYIPSKNVFLGVNSIDENVYFYKLSAGGGSPADSIPPAAPGSLRPR